VRQVSPHNTTCPHDTACLRSLERDTIHSSSTGSHCGRRAQLARAEAGVGVGVAALLRGELAVEVVRGDVVEALRRVFRVTARGGSARVEGSLAEDNKAPEHART
jgi:hypothetical protein